MKRLISHLLILLVLFIHSTVAMDVRDCHDNEQTTEHGVDSFNDANNANDSVTTDAQQDFCLDAGGHCSHNHVHTAGLVSLSPLSDAKTQTILYPFLITAVFIHTQAPPLHPPKA